MLQKCNRRRANARRRKISVYTWQTSLSTVYSIARIWATVESAGEYMHFAYVDESGARSAGDGNRYFAVVVLILPTPALSSFTSGALAAACTDERRLPN